MEKTRLDIEEIGNKYESFSYRALSYCVSRFLHGYFLFKRRKGEIVAGATTFFALLSFCPAIFLFISLLGYISGDTITSKAIVMDSLKESFPSLAPWIVNSINSIIDQQLKASPGFNIMNIAFLAYSLIGLVSAFMYGINAMIKGESKGGFIIEDIKSFFIGSLVATYILGLIATTNDTFLKLFVFNQNSMVPENMRFIFQSEYLPLALTLAFFTIFFRVIGRKKTTLKKSFLGASCFVTCFIAGKSFHWVYLNISKGDLTLSFGNFYTLVVAALWVYFLVCSFFYSTCVATVSKEELSLKKEEPQKAPLRNIA